jgi:hypothetical protein
MAGPLQIDIILISAPVKGAAAPARGTFYTCRRLPRMSAYWWSTAEAIHPGSERAPRDRSNGYRKYSEKGSPLPISLMAAWVLRFLSASLSWIRVAWFADVDPM